MRLQSVRIRNFKAIIDSKTVKLGPLTVFIGNNGAGKSSLTEALETYQSIVRDGLFWFPSSAWEPGLGSSASRPREAELRATAFPSRSLGTSRKSRSRG